MKKESGKRSEPDPSLHEFLERQDVYPHKPDNVKHIQTHISHVFIAPPFVYKIKKPVNFGFLDYSSLEKRKHFCEREVELNRRLCSDIYLGVISVSKGENGFTLNSDAKGEVVEYVVKMKKLKEEYFLYSYIDNDTLTLQHLDRVADKLADFYLQQEPNDDVLEYGKIEKIRYNTDENFQQTESFIGETIKREVFEAIKYFTNRYFDWNESLFKRRVQQKRIVDGHGDLHLDHIHVGPESICIYDCIEFNERFRYGDLAVDLAFLAMDLDFKNRWKEERYFVEQMARKLNDSDLPHIIDFYKCYRAYVKGKVKSLQSGEEEVSDDDRKEARKKAAGYFNLSLRYALLGSEPIVLIFMGRVGTGKSTLAEYLGDTLGIDCFSSDCIRKTLAELPLEERTPNSKREELYSAKMSERTYERLFEEAKVHLEQGKSVILDATFSKDSVREDLAKKLDTMDADYLFIEAQASDETITSRLKAREREEGVISDARLEDFKKLDALYESPKETNSINLISVKTDADLPETLETLYKKLADRQLEKDD